MKQVLNVVGALALGMGIVGLSVLLVLASSFTYPWFSGDVVNSANLSPERISENYRAVIRYCLLPWSGDFTIPHLRFSEAGAQHFAEAKAIFQGFIWSGVIGAVVAWIALLVNWQRNRAWGGLVAGGTGVLATIVMLGVIFITDFNRAFVIFHQIAFNNELWIFDPRTDPIINYLPESLFMANAFAILVLMVIGAMACIVVGLRLRRRVAMSQD